MKGKKRKKMEDNDEDDDELKVLRTRYGMVRLRGKLECHPCISFCCLLVLTLFGSKKSSSTPSDAAPPPPGNAYKWMSKCGAELAADPFLFWRLCTKQAIRCCVPVSHSKR